MIEAKERNRVFKSIGFYSSWYFVGVNSGRIDRKNALFMQKNDVSLWLGLLG